MTGDFLVRSFAHLVITPVVVERRSEFRLVLPPRYEMGGDLSFSTQGIVDKDCSFAFAAYAF